MRTWAFYDHDNPCKVCGGIRFFIKSKNCVRCTRTNQNSREKHAVVKLGRQADRAEFARIMKGVNYS